MSKQEIQQANKTKKIPTSNIFFLSSVSNITEMPVSSERYYLLIVQIFFTTKYKQINKMTLC